MKKYIIIISLAAAATAQAQIAQVPDYQSWEPRTQESYSVLTKEEQQLLYSSKIKKPQAAGNEGMTSTTKSAKANEYTERTAQQFLRAADTCPNSSKEDKEYSKHIILEANKIAKTYASMEHPVSCLPKIRAEMPSIVEAMFPNDPPEDKEYSEDALFTIIVRLLQKEGVIPAQN